MKLERITVISLKPDRPGRPVIRLAWQEKRDEAPERKAARLAILRKRLQ